MKPPSSEWFSAERILAVISVVMTVALAVYLVTFTQAQRVAGECQAQVNAEFRVALTLRTTAAGQERAALRQVLVDALAEPLDRQRTRDSLARYLDVLNTTDAERARTPIPTGAGGCT